MGLGMASEIAYVFCDTAACAPLFIKGIDVTIDIAKITNSAIASLFFVDFIFSFPLIYKDKRIFENCAVLSP